jgi:hypothetical protein
MKNKYYIELNSKNIGITYFENADPPMGVVMGKIIFNDNSYGYNNISNYCKENNIVINEDDKENKLIDTQSIPNLKVYNEERKEIKGEGTCISGMEEEGFIIDVFGIPYPFYGKEFPHHREAYDNQF